MLSIEEFYNIEGFSLTRVQRADGFVDLRAEQTEPLHMGQQTATYRLLVSVRKGRYFSHSPFERSHHTAIIPG